MMFILSGGGVGTRLTLSRTPRLIGPLKTSLVTGFDESHTAAFGSV